MQRELVTQPSAVPTRKVGAATLGAMAVSIAIDIAVANISWLSVVDPEQLETLLIGLGALAFGWLVRDRRNAL